jgi:hypothetical protein
MIFSLASTKAFFTVVRNVKVFSVDSLKNYEESVYNNFRENLDEDVFERSIAFEIPSVKPYWKGQKQMVILNPGANPNF